MILIDLPKICFRNILPFDPPDWNEIMPSTRITSVHKDQTRLQDVIGITYINLVSLADIFPFSWYIQFSSIDIRRVLLKPEGKSIVQHTAFIYRTMSGKRSSRGNTCNEDVYGRSLRCKTTCTLFPHKKAIQLDLCKALWPLTSFLEVHTADHCSLPISRWPWQTNLWHYFAYHVKTLIPRCNEHTIQMGESQMTRLPWSSVKSTESEKSSGVEQLFTCLGYKICSVYMNKRNTFAKKMLGWLWCERVCCGAVGFLPHYVSVCDQNVVDMSSKTFQLLVASDEMTSVFMIWSVIMSTVLLLAVIHRAIRIHNKQNRI